MTAWERLHRLGAVPHPPLAKAAVLVPLYEDANGDMRVVLTKRPDDMRSHPGDVVFPGGRMEGDEDPVATALREAWEEVALPPDNVVTVFGALTPVSTRDPRNLIVPVVARIDRDVELVPDHREVDVIIEPTIDDLLVERSWHTQSFFGHDLWFYEFDEGVLWGATAFMVRELLGHFR